MAQQIIHHISYLHTTLKKNSNHSVNSFFSHAPLFSCALIFFTLTHIFLFCILCSTFNVIQLLSKLNTTFIKIFQINLSIHFFLMLLCFIVHSPSLSQFHFLIHLTHRSYYSSLISNFYVIIFFFNTSTNIFLTLLLIHILHNSSCCPLHLTLFLFSFLPMHSSTNYL